MPQNGCKIYANAICLRNTTNFEFLLASDYLCLDFGLTAGSSISSIVLNVCDTMRRVLKRSLLLRKASTT